MHSKMLTLCLLAGIGLTCVGGALPHPAAAPEIIVFEGEALSEPVTTIGMERNHEFMMALSRGSGPTDGSLVGRAFVDVHMYWGMHWRSCARSAECIRSLAPESATTRGRLYLGDGARPAVYEPRWPPRGQGRNVVSPDGMAWLEKNGVVR